MSSFCTVLRRASFIALAAGALVPGSAAAATTFVPAGGDLQRAINAAQPGDTITLEPGGLYSGNFTLPVHAGTEYITIRSAAPDTSLPAPGVRISPSDAPNLP